MIRILCYGDSNTWGFIPGSPRKRFDENTRWPKVLQNLLGKNYEIIEEGLCGRTLCSEDFEPGKEGRNGFAYFIPCVKSHDKTDVLILMLGTNELKAVLGNSAKDVLQMLKKYTEYIKNYRSEQDGGGIKLIVCGLPRIDESKHNTLRNTGKFLGAEEKCKEVNVLYKKFCEENDILFVDNGDLEVGEDGLHLNAESHRALAEKLAKILKNLQ